jgi:hypothetical protein
MRDDEETRLVASPEPVIPLGPSLYAGTTGQAPETVSGPALDLTTPLAGPCIYTPEDGGGAGADAHPDLPIKFRRP